MSFGVALEGLGSFALEWDGCAADTPPVLADALGLELATGLSGWRLWALLVSISAGSGLAIYFGFGYAIYRRYYIKRRDDAAAWKIQPKRWQPAKKHRWGITVAAGNMVLGGLLSGSFVYYLSQGGYSTLYYDVDDYGLAYSLLSVVLMFFSMEAAAYYTHRFLHRRFMFRHIHRWHHRCVAVTPFNTVTMHPIEFVILQVVTFAPIFVLPVYYLGFIGLLIYVLVFNILDHSGVKMKHGLPWHSTTSFHDDHHVFFHCNFGQILGGFDRFHGTHRRVDRRYGKDVFGGKGVPVASDEPSPSDYVQYR